MEAFPLFCMCFVQFLGKNRCCNVLHISGDWRIRSRGLSLILHFSLFLAFSANESLRTLKSCFRLPINQEFGLWGLRNRFFFISPPFQVRFLTYGSTERHSWGNERMKMPKEPLMGYFTIDVLSCIELFIVKPVGLFTVGVCEGN